MPKPPPLDELHTSTDAVVLNAGEHDVIRFLYERTDHEHSGDGTIDIVLRHRKTHEQTHYRFHEVVLNYLPPVHSPYPIVVMNAALRKHEGPRPLAVSVHEDHPDTGVMFHASAVERIM